nr:hypothetical protein [Tanacetum cinerariifolium]
MDVGSFKKIVVGVVKLGAANVLTFMMLWGDSREFGSGQSSRDVGKNKLRNTFKCAICFKEFRSRSALVRHIKAIYKKCLVCSKVFESEEDLEDHKRANSCEKRFAQICMQEGATSSTSVHRNVREVAANALMNKRAHDNTKSEVDELGESNVEEITRKMSTIFQDLYCIITGSWSLLFDGGRFGYGLLYLQQYDDSVPDKVSLIAWEDGDIKIVTDLQQFSDTLATGFMDNSAANGMLLLLKVLFVCSWLSVYGFNTAVR